MRNELRPPVRHAGRMPGVPRLGRYRGPVLPALPGHRPDHPRGGELAMASGRPRQPNDPSGMPGAEAAVSSAARPGLATRLWHWRHEAALIAGVLLGTIGIGATLGLGWLTAAAAAVLAVLAAALAWPPSPAARHREGGVRHHAAPGQDRVHPRLDPDQRRPPAGRALHRARGHRRAGMAVAARGSHARGSGGGRGHPARRLLGRRRPSGGERPAQPHRRARGDTPAAPGRSDK